MPTTAVAADGFGNHRIASTAMPGCAADRTRDPALSSSAPARSWRRHRALRGRRPAMSCGPLLVTRVPVPDDLLMEPGGTGVHQVVSDAVPGSLLGIEQNITTAVIAVHTSPPRGGRGCNHGSAPAWTTRADTRQHPNATLIKRRARRCRAAPVSDSSQITTVEARPTSHRHHARRTHHTVTVPRQQRWDDGADDGRAHGRHLPVTGPAEAGAVHSTW